MVALNAQNKLINLGKGGCNKWCQNTGIAKISLKGSFTFFLFSVRTHILNSNGVWTTPCGIADFGRRGLKRPKSQIFGFLFCPQGPRLAAPRDLDSRRHHGITIVIPRWRRQSRSLGAATRGPCRRHSRSHVAPRLEVPGDKIKTQKIGI